MKVLLLQNIPKLGKKNEVKDVAAGFARNYLFPRELARPVQQPEIAELKKQHEVQKEHAKEELKHSQEVAARLEGLEIEIPAKVSEKGEAYSALSAKKIAAILKCLGHDVSADTITITEPIKHVGEHRITIALSDGIETEITVVLVADDDESAAATTTE